MVLTCITRFSVLVWLVSGLYTEYKMSVVWTFDRYGSFLLQMNVWVCR